MNSGNENSLNKNGNASSPEKSQQDKGAKKKSGSFSEVNREGSGTGQQKYDRKNQSDEKTKEEIDLDRHPGDEVKQPTDYSKKINNNYVDRSERH